MKKIEERLEKLEANMRARGTPACLSYACQVAEIRGQMQASGAENGYIVEASKGVAPAAWRVLSPAGLVVAITYSERDAETVRGAMGYKPAAAAPSEPAGVGGEVLRAARDVCAYDWSDNDEDAVEAIHRLRNAMEAAPQPPAEAPGWYCAHCQRGVDSSEVTYSEQHQSCGRYIANDDPPPAEAQAQGGWVFRGLDTSGRPAYGNAPRSAPTAAPFTAPSSAPVGVGELCKEASEVLAAVGVSGVPLPDNWRWPLTDELAGVAALAQQPAAEYERGFRAGLAKRLIAEVVAESQQPAAVDGARVGRAVDAFKRALPVGEAYKFVSIPHLALNHAMRAALAAQPQGASHDGQ